jgi:hypothetical protein
VALEHAGAAAAARARGWWCWPTPRSIAAVPRCALAGAGAHHEVVVLLLVDPLEREPPRPRCRFALGDRTGSNWTWPAAAQRQRWQREFVAPVEAALEACRRAACACSRCRPMTPAILAAVVGRAPVRGRRHDALHGAPTWCCATSTSRRRRRGGRRRRAGGCWRALLVLVAAAGTWWLARRRRRGGWQRCSTKRGAARAGGSRSRRFPNCCAAPRAAAIPKADRLQGEDWLHWLDREPAGPLLDRRRPAAAGGRLPPEVDADVAAGALGARRASSTGWRRRRRCAACVR